MVPEQLSEYDKTLPSVAEFKDTSKRFLWLLAALAAFVLLGLSVAKPLYGLVRTKRALTLTAEAEGDLKAGRLDEAGRTLHATLELAPNHPRVLRLAARYCSLRLMAEGLNYWQMLLSTPEASRQDQLDYLALCVAFNRADLGGPQIRAMLATNRTDSDVLRIQVQLARNTERPAVAIQAARAWVQARPGNEEAQFILGSFLAASPVGDERAEGRRMLWGLAVGDGRFQFSAIDALVPSSELTHAEIQVLQRLLSGRADHRLALLDLQLRLDPSRRAELTDELAKSALASGTPKALAEAATWFADHGETARVLQMLPPEKVAGQPVLLTARLQALLELDRVAEVQPYLEMPDPPVETYLLHCLRAVAAQKTGRPQLVLGHFESAIAACTNQPSKLQFVAGYAERCGQPTAAIAAYERLMRWPFLTFSAGRNILRLLGPMDDIKATRDTLRRLADFLPGDDSLYIASTYYAFLLDEVKPEARAELARRMAKRPDEVIYPLVLALGELRGGDAAKALGLIEGAGVDWDRAEPRMKAIYAAALGANQQREAARQVARHIDLGALKSAERELIKAWL